MEKNMEDIETEIMYLESLQRVLTTESKAELSCPVATKDIAVNLKNRKKAIDSAMYGPLNPEEENNDYWKDIADEWNVTEQAAKKQLCGNCSLFIVSPSMKDCISEGLTDDKDEWGMIDAAGELGYCEAFDFKCASKRTCRAWVVGGPITKDKKETKTIELKSLPKYDDYYSARPSLGGNKGTSFDEKALKQRLKDPKGGLTAAGRAYFNRTQGSKLKPGVKGPADTPEKMRRKGSFLTRFFTNPSGPMRDEKGRPTRLALSAAAWGEPVPKNSEDAQKLAAKGRRLLERYENTKKKVKNNNNDFLEVKSLVVENSTESINNLSEKIDLFLSGVPSISEKSLGSYTKPELRESIKKRIMAGSKGGRPGQWSARKAQLVASEYRKAGGGYRGKKRSSQRSLSKWTREKWTTMDGGPAKRKGTMYRYLPAKAWAKLTPEQRRSTNKKKIQGDRAGNQFVPNTEKAKKAGSAVRNS